MNEPRWLLDQTGVAVHSVVLEEHGRAPGIRDEDMLASAPNRLVNKYTSDSDATLFSWLRLIALVWPKIIRLLMGTNVLPFLPALYFSI